MSKLRRESRLWPFLIALGIATAAALAIKALSGMPLWACLAIAYGSLAVNGWLAEWEDNQPGGFNHPAPDAPPATENPQSKSPPKA